MIWENLRWYLKKRFWMSTKGKRAIFFIFTICTTLKLSSFKKLISKYLYFDYVQLFGGGRLWSNLLNLHIKITKNRSKTTPPPQKKIFWIFDAHILVCQYLHIWEICYLLVNGCILVFLCLYVSVQKLVGTIVGKPACYLESSNFYSHTHLLIC